MYPEKIAIAKVTESKIVDQSATVDGDVMYIHISQKFIVWLERQRVEFIHRSGIIPTIVIVSADMLARSDLEIKGGYSFNELAALVSTLNYNEGYPIPFGPLTLYIARNYCMAGVLGNLNETVWLKGVTK